MSPQFEGAQELDGGFLSALSEAYLTTNPSGMFIMVHFTGSLNLPLWQQALARLQEAFPIVSSQLKEVKQRVSHRLTWVVQSRKPQWEVIDFANEISPEFLLSKLQRPFQLFSEPPIRFILVRQGLKKFSIVVNSHHCASDGVTQLLLLRELVEQIHVLSSGQTKYDLSLLQRKIQERPKNRVRYGVHLRSLLQEFWERRRHGLVKTKRKAPTKEFKPCIRSFILNEVSTQALIQKAKDLNVSLNDLLNVAIIETLEKLRPCQNKMISACFPVNLRPYFSNPGRFANMTSGIYINLRPKHRGNSQRLLKNFVAKRQSMLSEGRAVLNLKLLQHLFRFFRLFPHRRRHPWLQRQGKYAATYLCSNLGKAGFEVPQSAEETEKPDQFQVRDWDVMIFPNRNVDYSIFALTMRHRLKIFISTDDGALGSQEPEAFLKLLPKVLTEGAVGS